MKFITTLLLAVGLTALVGCGTLMPKPVEFFQDKVRQFPETVKGDREAERQALEMAQVRVRELKEEALRGALDTNVTDRILDLEQLTDALAKNAGPPLKAPKYDAPTTARRLYESTANYIEKLWKFRGRNNENTGKEIEGTGLFQVPYFVWLGGVIVLVVIVGIIGMVLWTAFKAYSATNPPLALGLSVAQMGAKTAKSMLGQIISGGEKFKTALFSKAKEQATFTAEEVKELFRTEMEKAQDIEAKAVISHLTKKD